MKDLSAHQLVLSRLDEPVARSKVQHCFVRIFVLPTLWNYDTYIACLSSLWEQEYGGSGHHVWHLRFRSWQYRSVFVVWNFIRTLISIDGKNSEGY